MKKTLYACVTALALIVMPLSQVLAEESFETRLGKLATASDAMADLSDQCVTEVKVYGTMDENACTRFLSALNKNASRMDAEFEALREEFNAGGVDLTTDAMNRDAYIFLRSHKRMGRNAERIKVLLGN